MNGCPNCGEGKCAQCYPTRKISELERLRASETRLREGLRELAEDAEFNQNRPLLKRIRALLSLEGDKTAGVAASPEANKP